MNKWSILSLSVVLLGISVQHTEGYVSIFFLNGMQMIQHVREMAKREPEHRNVIKPFLWLMCLTSQVLTLIGLLACLNLNMHHSSITHFGDILRSV